MIELKNPPHPGEIVHQEVLEPLGLSVTAAARILGVSRPALSAMLNGRASLSPDMAIRIQKAFGPKMDHLLRMQCAFDIAHAKRRADHIQVAPYPPALP
jgi:addiction module HigA family antidote